MAYYNYKRVRDILPDWIISEQGEDYEGSCDYDGDLWVAAEEYILYLEEVIRLKDPTFNFISRSVDGN